MANDKVVLRASEVTGDWGVTLQHDGTTSHAIRLGQELAQRLFHGILTKATIGHVFTRLESKGLWDLIHLRAEGLHWFSPKFDCYKAKTGQMLGRNRW